MAASTIPEDLLELYNELVAQFEKVERKGKNNPYTSLNGHMFSFLVKENGTLALRMSKEDKAAFEAKFNSEPVVTYGTVMKEYVAVPEDLQRNLKKLMPYFQQSYVYVSGLKPKPTKKK